MFWQDGVWLSQGTGEESSVLKTVCVQEERFTLKRISSWLLAGPGVAILGAKLIWAESGGISLQLMKATPNLLPSEPGVLF